MYLGWDIGIKNLSYCLLKIVNKKNNRCIELLLNGKNVFIEIVSWDVINIVDNINSDNNEFTLSKRDKLNCSFNKCKKVIQKSIPAKWSILFPQKTGAINYKDELAYCTFEVLFDIIKNFIPETNILRINQLKEILIEQYNKYNKEIYKIGHILHSEGKIELSDKLLLVEVKIDIAIMSDNYYITNLDLILIIKYFNIPVILLSQKALKENNKLFTIINKSITNEYYFIYVSPSKVDTSSPFKLFSYGGSIKININRIGLPLQTEIKISNDLDLTEYISNFNLDVRKTKVVTKKPQLKIVEKPKIQDEQSDDDLLDDEGLLNALSQLDDIKPLIKKPE